MRNWIRKAAWRIRAALGCNFVLMEEVLEWRLTHLFVKVFDRMGEQGLDVLELTPTNIASFVEDHPGGEWRAPTPAKAWKKLYKWLKRCRMHTEVTYSRRGGPRRVVITGDRERIIVKRMDPPENPGGGMQDPVKLSPAESSQRTE